MKSERITEPSRIIEMEILGGIDRLFHQLNVTFGYNNIYSKAYADVLAEMLPDKVRRVTAQDPACCRQGV